MQFTKLRLAGFKSFVDATDMVIAPGMTGIVGPNGCGKSNLVEALRWIMGETSAKQMRGGAMDNVIFGGTSDRPARNIGEVTLYLDNSDRTAPAAFNDHDDLEVSRRIEREKGSTYRVNGREVRARDVQLLFADQATGPRSTALVSQGRVGALINAKPAARRTLLEEAAGITGLHSRRHEAELRLRSAETNLTRLDDVLAALETQLADLKKQARQAKRYRNISDNLRQAEATVLHHRWQNAETERNEAETKLAEADRIVAALTERVVAATTAREQAAEALGPLREAEAQAAAELQRLNLARNELAAEQRRLTAQKEQTETRLAQLADDLQREQTLAGDATAALDRLTAERQEIEAKRVGEQEALDRSKATLDAAVAETSRHEQDRDRLNGEFSAAEARRKTATREADDLQRRAERFTAERQKTVQERETLAAEIAAASGLEQAEAAVAEQQRQLAAARTELDQAEEAKATAEAAIETARQTHQELTAERARIKAETEALVAVLDQGTDGNWPPLLDGIEVDPGFETALGAALGDDLDAPASEEAPKHWRLLPQSDTGPNLPGGIDPLSRFVRGDNAPQRRLLQIGVVENAERGRALASQLLTGQRLVSRDGDLWRWDGFVVKAGAPTAAAQRLKQRNRLAELEPALADAERNFADSEQRLNAARATLDTAGAREREARQAHRTCDKAVETSRAAYDRAQREAASRTSRLESLAEILSRIDGDVAETETRLQEAQATLAELSDLAPLQQAIDNARENLSHARDRQNQAHAAHHSLVHEANLRNQRLSTIANDQATWQQRKQGADTRIAEIGQRRAAAESELAQLAARPGEIETQLHSLRDSLERAEQQRGTCADRLATGETTQAEAEKLLRTVEGELAGSREDRVRAESLVAQAEQTAATVKDRIAERLQCRPEGVLAAGDIKEGANLPDLEAAERRLERLLRERDNMGPVNLRAEMEAEELDQQIATMQEERGDLIAAIERLRRGIGTLNREARQRLMESFAEVNQHFQELFARLFGGGRAHLELIESDDPLEAGLEIFASPPGKNLQALSLLSGGEQALTAISLLFAVFLTNPAPICVLDEVDAPLDDANVDRFCNLVENIAHRGSTRMILVTHHRMTMARMDRLFGVTMPERGVSQLVSVDLGSAEALRKTA